MNTRLSNRSLRLSSLEQLLLQSIEGLRAVEIADACGVDRRTVYRDLTVLREMGVPVYQKNGRFFINRDYYLAKIRLNMNEAVSLFFAIRLMGYHQGRDNPHLVSALRKLSDILPLLLAEQARAVADALWEHGYNRAYKDVLETVISGWWQQRVVKLWVDDGVIDFAPYLIEPSPQGGMLLFGRDVDNDRLTVLELKQLQRARLTKSVCNAEAQDYACAQRYFAEHTARRRTPRE